MTIILQSLSAFDQRKSESILYFARLTVGSKLYYPPPLDVLTPSLMLSIQLLLVFT